jgi:hypothetical protein
MSLSIRESALLVIESFVSERGWADPVGRMLRMGVFGLAASVPPNLLLVNRL